MHLTELLGVTVVCCLICISIMYVDIVLFQVTVLSACGEECVIATKVNTAVDK